MSFRRSGLTLALIALWVSLAAAQGVGRIEGRVTGKNGRGIGGVSVVINEISAAELTDSKGNFAFPRVPPGTYSLTFTLRNQADTESGVPVLAPPVGVHRDVEAHVGALVGGEDRPGGVPVTCRFGILTRTL